MKSILVPVEDNDQTDTILATAATIGERFGSNICGFALVPATTPYLAADTIGNSIIYEPLGEFDEETLAKARQRFGRFMDGRGIPAGSSFSDTANWSWKDGVPPGDHVVGNLSRVYDVTVIGHSRARLSGPRSTTFDAALFDSGRPILIAPPEAPPEIGRTVLIHWNRSTESARTIAFALPILDRAEDVIVLSVEGSGIRGPNDADLEDYLKRRGVPARSRHVDPGKRSPGQTILDEAGSLGCDLLIKGAFTQSRLRQIIFGGATQHILAEATLPVFMAH